jgi:hypothetical protein
MTVADEKSGTPTGTAHVGPSLKGIGESNSHGGNTQENCRIGNDTAEWRRSWKRRPSCGRAAGWQPAVGLPYVDPLASHAPLTER